LLVSWISEAVPLIEDVLGRTEVHHDVIVFAVPFGQRIKVKIEQLGFRGRADIKGMVFDVGEIGNFGEQDRALLRSRSQKIFEPPRLLVENLVTDDGALIPRESADLLLRTKVNVLRTDIEQLVLLRRQISHLLTIEHALNVHTHCNGPAAE